MGDEWQLVRDALANAGVSGIEDFGRFVNNTTYFTPSTFDEQAAAPVLVALLPMLHDPRLVATVGRHLQRARIDADGYAAVRTAFANWATEPSETGWVLGDTLARAADKSRADELIDLATTRRYGPSRGCIVEALWRFKSVTNAEEPLRRLIADPDVSLMAMTALQRTIGADATKPILEDLLLDTTTDPTVQQHARRQLKRISKKLSRPATGA